ncbi:antitermination protein [Labrenzia sp. OB1]|uniref:antitermination protein n=1 Tax=Labrenzia sp. OB1 TaxID=1561204 RepID=UPI0007B22696|nr:antitermination protein [Labrenzia sp. OB1]KZM50366.1 antitermination protein [Labrenzia sp. OB1]
MNKKTIAATSTFAVILAGIGFAVSGSFDADRELRRVDCHAITMFTPAHNKPAEDLCANYGGVALKDAQPSKQGLVILVRNQPMGGFDGDKALH